MGRRAQQIGTAQARTARLEGLVDQLAAHSQVLLLCNGSSCDGVVSTLPSVQLFRNDGTFESIHASVTLLGSDVREWSRRV